MRCCLWKSSKQKPKLQVNKNQETLIHVFYLLKIVLLLTLVVSQKTSESYLVIPCQKSMDPKREPATLVLLISHVVKLPSNYLCLYRYVTVAPKLGQRSSFFTMKSCLLIETQKVLRIRDCWVPCPKWGVCISVSSSFGTVNFRRKEQNCKTWIMQRSVVKHCLPVSSTVWVMRGPWGPTPSWGDTGD